MQVTDRESAHGPVSITMLQLHCNYHIWAKYNSQAWNQAHSGIVTTANPFIPVWVVVVFSVRPNGKYKKPMEHQHHQHLMARSTNFPHVQSLQRCWPLPNRFPVVDSSRIRASEESGDHLGDRIRDIDGYRCIDIDWTVVVIRVVWHKSVCVYIYIYIYGEPLGNKFLSRIKKDVF